MGRIQSPVYKAIVSRRTVRRFQQRSIRKGVLKKLINAARLAPSAANLQPLEFILITDHHICKRLFTHIQWAGYIAPLGTPAPGARPVAYIAVLINKMKAQLKYAAYDIGAAVENILLAAWEQNIGSCWMQAINRRRISKILGLPEALRLDSIIALGYKDESPKAEAFRGSIKYWKDRQGKLHVPKRSLKQVIYKELK
ncbi:nitroreductase family protein [Candidatus Omnitrophota bacterium]